MVDIRSLRVTAYSKFVNSNPTTPIISNDSFIITDHHFAVEEEGTSSNEFLKRENNRILF